MNSRVIANIPADANDLIVFTSDRERMVVHDGIEPPGAAVTDILGVDLSRPIGTESTFDLFRLNFQQRIRCKSFACLTIAIAKKMFATRTSKCRFSKWVIDSWQLIWELAKASRVGKGRVGVDNLDSMVRAFVPLRAFGCRRC
jgi:hypothetical protein